MFYLLKMEKEIMRYFIRRTTMAVALDAPWDSDIWEQADTAEINNFFVTKKAGDFKPEAKCRILYDSNGIYILFKVKDRYVKSTTTKLNESVCRDSCVEFFVEPDGNGSYINYEFNCGGNMLAFAIKDCTRTSNGFADSQALNESDASEMEIFHTMPQVVNPEIVGDTEWRLGIYIPFTVFSRYTDCKVPEAGTIWRGNFYKCGDRTSNPHWASWSPISELNFHLPQCFQAIEFA
jgi:Carbohydrate-binding family 9